MAFGLAAAAKILSSADAAQARLRNRVIVLLSAKAGLRAGEIANLTWAMVLDASGHVGSMIELQDVAAKKGSGRRIPLHAELKRCLAEWKERTAGHGPVIPSERGGAMRPISIVIWFSNAYKVLHLDGCSSHSGRRTFITS